MLPESEQEWNESRRLWSGVTAAIKKKDLDAATDAKTAIEDAQRESARQREEKNEKFDPKYFVLEDDEWRPKIRCANSTAPAPDTSTDALHARLPKDRKEADAEVQRFIFGEAGGAPAKNPQPDPAVPSGGGAQSSSAGGVSSGKNTPSSSGGAKDTSGIHSREVPSAVTGGAK